MATWGTEIQKAGNALENAFQTFGRGTGDLFSSVKRNISEIGTFFKNGGTTVVGINVNKITDMKTAITNYCDGVNGALAELKNYDPTVAFKGTQIESALVGYIEAIITACSAIVSNLESFNDQLTLVEQAYATKDDVQAQAIKNSADSARNEFTSYSSNSAQ